jgi:hypothetical protein
MLAGRFTPAGEAVSAMVAPLLSAAAVSATVQVADADEVSEIGLHVKPFNAGWIIPTLFPVVDIAIDTPAASAPAPFESGIVEDVSVVELETVRETVAMTPLEIGVVLRPYNTQIKVPAVALVHETVLLAATAAGPACTVAEEKSVVE